MKNILIGIAFTFVCIAFFMFVNTDSNTMTFIAGLFLGLGIGLFFSINRIKRN